MSADAVTHMLLAVHNGNGSMAQFSHPEFGGSGQWMRGGMTMVSDLFNYQLKSRVDNLCNDIANALASHQLVPFFGSFQSQNQGGSSAQSQAAGTIGSTNSLFVPDPAATWWPSELGSPSATGSQNNVRYAYFSHLHRLAVKTSGDVWVYDTLDHQISGFSQQQGHGGSITFTSQFGTVNLSPLPVLSRGGATERPNATFNPPHAAAGSFSIEPPPVEQPSVQPSAHTPLTTQPFAQPSTGTSTSTPRDVGHDILDTLERLGALKDKGYITDEEFASKKAELLSRL
ncbi:MAG: SHOCT domain-containing protein [Pirellulaceae bacterium]|nr:SHOCT domain-containing protein [Pirellulaceae bacterium]